MRGCVLGCTRPILSTSIISQEVVGGSACDMWLSTARRRVKHQEIVIHLFVDLHYSGLVATPITIVWRWEDRHNLLLMAPIIARHYELMGASHRFEPVLLYELVWYVLSKGVAGSAWRDTPARTVVWIWPQQVAHWAFMRYLNNTVNISDHVQGVQAGAQATMKAEDLIFNDSCQRKVVKEVRQVLPDVGIAVLSETLVIKAINLCDLSTFMITAENRDAFLKAYFEADEKCDGLHRVVSTIDVVTHEEVICIRWAATDLEKLHKIVELTVDIAADCNWAPYRLYIDLIL